MTDNKLCDDSDIDREVKSLFITTNIILRRFVKCTRLVKLRLFRSYFRASDSIILFDIVRVINHLYVCIYCLCFYDISLWTNFSVASHKKNIDCATQMLFELGLPSWDKVLFNAKVRLRQLEQM